MASLRHHFEGPGDEAIRLVVDTIPTLAWSAGPDGSAEFFNQRWLDYTGLSAEQAAGSGWAVAIHPDDLNDLMEYWRRVVASGQPGEIEARLRRSDGVYGWFLFRAAPSLDKNGRVVKWYGTNTDIEERKRAEQVLAVQNTRLQLLLQLTKRVTSNLELRELLRSISANVRNAMHADAAGVAFFDEVSDKSRIYAVDFPDAKGFVREEIVVTPGLAFKRAWVSSKPAIITANDPEELGPEIYGLAVAEGLNGHCLIPLVSRGRTVGVLIVARKLEGSFTREDIDFLSEASGQIAIAIENSLAYAEIFELKEKLAQIVDTIPTLAWAARPDGSAEFFNQRWLDYTGLSAKQALNSGWKVAIHPDDLPRMLETFREALKSGKPYEVEGRFRRFDGEFRSFLVRGSPLRDRSGKVAKWYGTNTDLEDRKRAEDALRKTEERWRSVFENSAIGVALNDLSGRFLAANHVYQTIVGYTEEELRGFCFLDVTHEDDREANLALITELLEGKRRQFQIEKKYLRKDGSSIWVSNNVSLVPGTERVPRFMMALSEDITQRKRAEEALQRSEGYLAEAQKLTHTGSWAAQVTQKEDVYWSNVYWSKEMYRIFGLDPNPTPPSPMEVARQLHPEDAPYHPRVVERAIRDGTDFEIDYRLLLPDGAAKYVHVVGHPVVNASGDVIELFGTAMDVTEQHEARAALQRSEAFLAQGQSLSHTGSFGWSVLSGEIYWSEETYNIFQCDRAVKPTLELVLQRIHPDDRDLVQQIIDDASEERAYLDFQHRLMMPDGSVKHLHVMARALKPSSGKLEFVGAVTDITAAKQAEEKLRRNEWNLLEAQRLGRSGSWSLDVSSGTVTNTPEIWRAFGVKPGEDCSRSDFWFNRIHPEDRKRVRDLFERCLVEKTDYEAEFRVLRPDGTITYQHAIGRPIVNAAGNLVEFVGASIDVTEQCEARAALQTAFEQLKAEETELRRMTDAIASYIYVLGPDGTALYANQTLLDYTGLTLEDVRREDLRARVFHPEDVERLRDERQEALARGEPFELEQRALGKDGNYRWFLVRYNPLRDDHGNIIRWYATGTDIEDRKRAEERIRDENLVLREQIDQTFMFEEIVGSSPALQTVLSSVVKVAPTDSTVLITGETGTGKELIARAIHKHSQRSGQAFISVNCASIPSSLIASELFGHEKGAFTGAMQRRQGRFELAHSGTIFLDEVGELPAETQIALLRVLQERQFERVGGNRILSTDVRVIAATNRDLTAAIAAGMFRADLFYRLNVFPIEIPPLRKRKEDIPMLVEYFVKRYAEKTGKHIRKIDMNTLEMCQSYPWPGNIRELQNIVERSVILCSGDTFWIEKAWLASAQPPQLELAGPLPDTLQNQERKMIEAALAESKGKVAGPEGAAAKLGIPRSTLDTKISQLGIDKRRFISKQ
jgi:PAS domain S-box-containing protein